MARSNTSARQAGSRHERVIADYLKANLSRFIDRRVKTGAKDKGDLVNVCLADALGGAEIAVECKDTAKVTIGEFLTEAETERLNLGAPAGLVVSKRRGKSHPGDQIVLMTVDDLIAIVSGTRPDRTVAA